MGTPPPTRGKSQPEIETEVGYRNTPAYAGKIEQGKNA